MPRFQRPCLVCGALANDSYCLQHRTEINARRQAAKDTPERLARKRLLYGGDYKQRRKQVLATATHCAICQKPFTNGDRVETDHVVPSNPNSPLQATHASCNRSKGNRPTI
jgi:5-methylcytosine-specific restriction endonuclease McrA